MVSGFNCSFSATSSTVKNIYTPPICFYYILLDNICKDILTNKKSRGLSPLQFLVQFRRYLYPAILDVIMPVETVNAHLVLLIMMTAAQCQYVMIMMVHGAAVTSRANGFTVCQVSAILATYDALPVNRRCVDERLILFHEVASLVIKRYIVLKNPHDNDFDDLACLLLAA